MRTVMNDKEELKKAVIESCINGTMTIKVAADRLNFSERYVKKLKARYKKYGASSMMHGNCGKQPKHTITADVKSKIGEIWNLPELEECNFTHFQEILEEDYGIHYTIDLEQNLEGTILQLLKKQMNFLKHIFPNLTKNLLLNLKIKSLHLWNYQSMLI